jgi:hypothetical protein
MPKRGIETRFQGPAPISTIGGGGSVIRPSLRTFFTEGLTAQPGLLFFDIIRSKHKANCAHLGNSPVGSAFLISTGNPCWA